MNSVCIKTNNSDILDYLLDQFNYFDLENVFFSSNQFKNYRNVIIHYTGKDIDSFYSKLSSILSSCVIQHSEESLLKQSIYHNYFYFDYIERQKILELCYNLLTTKSEFNFENRENLLITPFYNYIFHNKQILLEGFIRFRLKEYMCFLNNLVDTAVNKFIIEREYKEFISLLKLYIDSQITTVSNVHLIYQNSHSILLDENKIPIQIEDHIFDAKYLSDISFSSNDYALNSLLTLVPQKIYIHLINSDKDEFINTLELVFENRIEFCFDCSLCGLYKQKSNSL